MAEWTVDIDIWSHATLTIEAESKEDAIEEVEGMLDSNKFCYDLLKDSDPYEEGFEITDAWKDE